MKKKPLAVEMAISIGRVRVRELLCDRESATNDTWEKNQLSAIEFCDRHRTLREKMTMLAWKMKLLTIVETLYKETGKDIVNHMMIFVYLFIIIDMSDIVFGVWMILITITNWVWLEITMTNWVIIRMINCELEC